MLRPQLISCWACLALLANLAACGDPAEPTDREPVITISGVEPGGSYTGPVTITVSVDRGSFEARLNGEAFLSGSTVARPGDYTLIVTARAGAATATREIAFRILLQGTSLLIVRALELGANDAGGGGDAILVTDSSAAGFRHGLVDAGPAGANGSDPAFVARRLAALGVDTLEFIILSHAHGDHFEGLPPVLERVHVRRFLYNGQVRDFSFYQSVIATARAHADSTIVPAGVYELAFGADGATTLSVLPPLPDFLANAGADSRQLNEGTLGARLRRGSFEMFFAGDGEVMANQRWRTQFSGYTAELEVLKVGHHGANDAIFDNAFSGSSVWLQHTSPELAVISANGTTHPRRNAIERLLAQAGLRTLCTHVHGTVEIRIAPSGVYRVDVARDSAAACTPGTQATT